MSIALDIALLLPDTAAAVAVETNRRLDGGRPGGLTLDATHLPHITLVQLFAEERRVGELCGRVDAAASAFGPLDLHVRGLDDQSGTAMLVFEENGALRQLHAALMKAALDFETAGGASAFRAACADPGDRQERLPRDLQTDDLPARDRDVEWVATYREQHSREHYLPHVTVGHGSGGGTVNPFAFQADRLAVCHLGRYCTCRAILWERWLPITR